MDDDWGMDNTQDSFEAERALDLEAAPDVHYADEYPISDEQAHTTRRSVSIGGLLGKAVNLAYKTVSSILALLAGIASMTFVLLLRILASIFDIILIRPLSWISNASHRISSGTDLGTVIKYGAGLVALWVVVNGLNNDTSHGFSLSNWLPSFQQHQPISINPNDISASTVQEIMRRLQDVETRLSDISYTGRRTADRLDHQSRTSSEVLSKLESLESAVNQEVRGRVDSDEKSRAASAAALKNLRAELISLMSQYTKAGGTVSDDKLRSLEQRVTDSEAGLRDAIERLKASLKTEPVSGSGPSTGWWTKLSGSDGKQLVIKSGDGQDVTSLIGTLVDSAVLRWSKDVVGKPDYAMYYAGGRIIPALTSDTYQVSPSGLLSYAWGSLTGRGFVEGKAPVHATHPDLSVGNCWPIHGSTGQLGVMLARSVIITEFTIDHAAKEVAYDIRSAPKKMEVWGLVEGAENVKKIQEYHRRREQRHRDLVATAQREGRPPPAKEDPYPESLPESEHYIRLAQFTYDVRKDNHIQTFSVPQDIQDLGVDIGIVVLFIKSNWGQPEWTCLYRFRVHGHDIDRRPYPLPDIKD